MTFSRTKLMLFHRGSSDKLILLTPDGHLSKIFVTWYGVSVENHPCYGGAKTFIEFDEFEGPNIRRKFSSAKAAYQAMRKYEKKNNLPKAEFIGTI